MADPEVLATTEAPNQPDVVNDLPEGSSDAMSPIGHSPEGDVTRQGKLRKKTHLLSKMRGGASGTTSNCMDADTNRTDLQRAKRPTTGLNERLSMLSDKGRKSMMAPKEDMIEEDIVLEEEDEGEDLEEAIPELEGELKPWFKAVGDEDYDQLKRLKEEGADPNAKNQVGCEEV